jgi:hypothetical protein
MADMNRRRFLIVSTTMGSALAIPIARGAGDGTDYPAEISPFASNACSKLDLALNMNGVAHRGAEGLSMTHAKVCSKIADWSLNPTSEAL